MLEHAYAPSKVPPPILYARYTWVKEIGLSWAELGGIDTDEIGLLAEMLNIVREAEGLKQRVNRGH